MKRLAMAALLYTSCAAYAMTTPHPGKSLPSSAPGIQLANSADVQGTSSTEDDEAAPPVHIHHAHTVSHKTPHRPVVKKPPVPGSPLKFSLLFQD